MAWSTLARMQRNGAVERVAHGVYRIRGASPDPHLALEAAWLQLAPETASWDRDPTQGVVSHRSAAAIYRLGHLPADVHHFVLPARRQSRRPDVHLHRAQLADDQWIRHCGLLVTRPARTAADLLAELEDPESVAHVIADALRGAHDNAAAIERAIRPHAVRFGLARNDGLALLDWLLSLTGDPEGAAWLEQALSSRQAAAGAAHEERNRQ